MSHGDPSRLGFRGGLAAAAGTALLLLVLYVAAYASLVTVNDGPSAPDFVMGEAAAEYRFGGAAAEFVFTPIHAIDRRVRPSVWTFDPPMIQPDGPP